MASRVLLISANRCTVPDPVFPLGIAQLAGALQSRGHTVECFDVLTTGPALGDRVQAFRPDLVGISLRNIDDVLIRKQQTFFNDLRQLCTEVRSWAACPIVIGGSGFSIFPKELLELSGADYGIAGAGESTLPQLIDALRGGEDPKGLGGLVYRNGGGCTVNPPSVDADGHASFMPERPSDLAKHYLQSGGMLNLQTQRGCRFQCCYCTYPLIEGRSPVRRSPELVAQDFERLQRMGAKYAFIVDSIFNSSSRHVAEVCEAILRRGTKLAWGCFLRPQGLTPELAKLMKLAGMTHAEFGSDSFSDAVLRTYRKGFAFGDIVESNRLVREAGIDCCHFLIAGGPGETAGTLEDGFRNSEKLGQAVIMAVVGMRIYPGTALEELARAEGRIDPATNLLQPVYYLAPGLSADQVFATLRDFARRSPNWIVGDPSPGYLRFVERLRSRGVVGPLWSYMSMLQRFWPAAADSTTRTKSEGA